MEVTVIGIRRGSDFLEVSSLQKTSKNGRRAYFRIFLNFCLAVHIAVKENYTSMDDVTRVHTITYGDFFRDFLLENQLCVFSSEITEDWRSRKEWVTNGKPNLEFLSNRFGKSEIFFFSFARSSWITIKIININLNC